VGDLSDSGSGRLSYMFAYLACLDDDEQLNDRLPDVLLRQKRSFSQRLASQFSSSAASEPSTIVVSDGTWAKTFQREGCVVAGTHSMFRIRNLGALMLPWMDGSMF